MRFASLPRTLLLSLLVTGCVGEADHSDREGLPPAGKGDGVDVCAANGWYDDADGYCDGDYCAMPDPDCGPDVDACDDTEASQGMSWNGDASVGCVADAGDLQTRTLAIYEDNLRAHKFINRLLEGHAAQRVRDAIAAELSLIAGNIATLEKTNYQNSPQRVRYMESMLATRDDLNEFLDLLDELEVASSWQNWFDPASICHQVETLEFQIAAEIRAIIDVHLISVSWETASLSARKAAVDAALQETLVAYPSAGDAIARLRSHGLDEMVSTPTVEIAHARLSFFLQVSVTGKLTRLSCPGDDRVEESIVHYEASRYYNYAAIIEKDIWMIRNDTGYISPNRLDDSRRYKSASYRFSFQGIERAGSVLAGPVDQSELVLNIRESGEVVRGPAYDRYFTQYGVELPRAVKVDQIESLIRSVDAYLAGYLESVQLELCIEIVLGIEIS